MKRVFVFAMFLWTGIMGVSAQEDRCDVNGDGVVNINDVIYVVDHVLGKGHADTSTGEVGEAVDLGLPSRTKWASCNVGATKPEEYGGYYAWGETEEKDYYSKNRYKYYQNGVWDNLGDDISGTDYDVAHVKWGGDWVMPTLDDIQELEDNCTSEWTTLNNVNGLKFTGPNGKSIFLPAAGVRAGGRLDDAGSDGRYWSSNPFGYLPDDAFALHFHLGSVGWSSDHDRDYGFSVRPVVRN